MVPGNVHVSGALMPGSSCSVLEPPPPPPQPEVSFDLRAPGSVAPGERFTVELRTTSDAPLLAVTAAMDCDEAVLSLERLEVLPRWNTSTAFVYAEITAGKGE
ncbi:MAG TPA: hypothetical protein VMT52_10420, partial [Planctomycetota bacterium]|nr:hypothetical protein [Planctomycetota bacterium]